MKIEIARFASKAKSCLRGLNIWRCAEEKQVAQHLSEARLLLKQNAYAGALERYRQSLEGKRLNLEGCMGAAICLLQLHRYDEVLAVVDRARAQGAPLSFLADQYVRALVGLGEFDRIDVGFLNDWKAEKPSVDDFFYETCKEIVGGLLLADAEKASEINWLLCEIVQQPPRAVGTDQASVLLDFAFSTWAYRKAVFFALIKHIEPLWRKHGESLLHTPDNAAFFLTFGRFLAEDMRARTLARFFLQFEIHAHWSYILIHSQLMVPLDGAVDAGVEDAFANIAMARDILRQRLSSMLEGATPRDLFRLLQIAAVLDTKARHGVVSEMRERLGRQDVIEDALEPDFRFIAERGIHATAKPFAAKERLKIAVCISGQLRGYINAFASFEHWGIFEHDVHFFVHTWADTGIRPPNKGTAEEMLGGPLGQAFALAWDALGEAGMIQNYPCFFSLWRDETLTDAPRLSQFYGADDVTVENDRASPFADYSNAHKMYYKIRKCHEMAMAQGDFDLVIRIRPDLYFPRRRFDLMQMYRRSVEENALFVSYQPGHYCFPGIGLAMADFIAIGTPEAMAGYAAADAMTNREGMYAHLRQFPATHIAHGNVAFATLYHGITLSPLVSLAIESADIGDPNVQIKRFHSPAPEAMISAIEADAAGRMNVFDQAMLGALTESEWPSNTSSL